MKIEEIIKQLIEVTVKESEMYPSLQSKVWFTIGMVEELLDLALDSLIRFAIENQLGSRPAEVVADTAVTLASANVELVSGKIIARLRKFAFFSLFCSALSCFWMLPLTVPSNRAINKTGETPVSSINMSSAWGEICILIRFALMLSFNNRLNVQQFLPEIFFLVSMVTATGPALIRTSVRGLVVNTVQSLCTSVALPESNMKTLSLLLSDFSEPKFKLLFGITKGTPYSKFLIFF